MHTMKSRRFNSRAQCKNWKSSEKGSDPRAPEQSGKRPVEEWELGLGLETPKTEWATRKRKVFQGHTKGGAGAEGAVPTTAGHPDV